MSRYWVGKMPRQIARAFLVPILLLGSTTSCATIARAPTPPPADVPTDLGPSSTPEGPLALAATQLPTSSSESWRTYSSTQYGFSISYPSHLEIINNESNASLDIGEQIHVWVADVDPLDCRGGCPFLEALVESTDPATVAGLHATRVAGYFGVEGGSTPQRFVGYILQRDGRYYSFVLSALGRHPTSYDVYSIWPLKEDDIALFEQVLGTIKFTD